MEITVIYPFYLEIGKVELGLSAVGATRWEGEKYEIAYTNLKHDEVDLKKWDNESSEGSFLGKVEHVTIWEIGNNMREYKKAAVAIIEGS